MSVRKNRSDDPKSVTGYRRKERKPGVFDMVKLKKQVRLSYWLYFKRLNPGAYNSRNGKK
jgi:hypothetical protein